MANDLIKQPIQCGEHGVIITTLEDGFRFATAVIASGLAPKSFRTPEAVLIAVQMGAEVGLKPMQSLQNIAVINGRPSLWGDAMKALVESSPECEYIQEYTEGSGDALTAVCEAKRRGRPNPSTERFSVRDARLAGLWGKAGPWMQYPARMLKLRARGFALRDQFPDLLCGMVSAEEAGDYPQAELPTIQSGDTVAGTELDALADAAEAELPPPTEAEAASGEDEAGYRAALASGEAKELF